MSTGPGADVLGVSRETYADLERFAALVEKWTPRINLISRRDIPLLWTRHIADSIQLFDVLPKAQHWVDLGSGGGFPGIIAAILAKTLSPETKFTMIESDTRKSVFLRTAIRECGLNGQVLNARIESVDPQSADVVTARALADLDLLLDLSTRHAEPNATFGFPKGKSWGKEVDNARARWQFDCSPVTSKTDPDGALLIIKGVSRD